MCVSCSSFGVAATSDSRLINFVFSYGFRLNPGCPVPRSMTLRKAISKTSSGRLLICRTSPPNYAGSRRAVPGRGGTWTAVSSKRYRLKRKRPIAAPCHEGLAAWRTNSRDARFSVATGASFVVSTEQNRALQGQPQYLRTCMRLDPLVARSLEVIWQAGGHQR